MNIKRPEQEPRVAQVVDKVQGLIRSGELRPGDRLLPERLLAEELGVSRGSVRAALAKLAGMGIVEIARDGARVRRRQLDDAVAPFSEFLGQERESLFHLLEVRQVIEIRAVELASRRAGEADVLRLHELALQVEADFRAGCDTDQSDTEFHMALVSCAKNPLLIRVMQVVVATMHEVYRSTRNRMMEDPELASRFIEEHRALVAAITAKDAERARVLMEQHIATIMGYVNQTTGLLFQESEG